MIRPVARTVITTLVALLTGLAATLTAAPAEASRIVTPGNFTGYGFDQCETVSQKTMNTWLRTSPFLAVGVYISGRSRACRTQANLTPTWVDTQLRKGWRILPITLGPQSSCVGRFLRYGPRIDPTIRESSTNGYAAARDQGILEADRAVAAATRLGIAPRSTLWYDLEGWSNVNDVSCRASALSFLQAWTKRLHRLGYVSGVYSSAGSGMVILDRARVNRPRYVLPDYIWIARWDGKANTSTTYISEAGWNPHRRVKQYLGGHDETWGGVTVNIDRNFLDVGKGSWAPREDHCNGTRISYPRYQRIAPNAADTVMVEALKCLLKERGVYDGRVNGTYNERLRTALRTWQRTHGFGVRDVWSRANWMSLLVAGPDKVLKWGSGGPAVRRLQRALNAAHHDADLRVTGVFKKATGTALRTYQRRVGVRSNGIAAPSTWRALRNGKR
jgi:hypothetical protein